VRNLANASPCVKTPGGDRDLLATGWLPRSLGATARIDSEGG